MTKKEMENSIRNLQSAVSALAAKTNSRNSDTEDDLAKANGRIEEVNAAVLLADETAIEMYESLENQIAINMAQDESLIEIYEIMEA